MKQLRNALLALVLLCLMLPGAALAADSAPAGTLSDDIYAFEALIEGTVFAFPCPLSAFTDAGWSFKDKEESEMMLETNSYTFSVPMVKGNIDERMEINLRFINFDINSQPLTNCYVGGVTIAMPYSEDDKAVTAEMAKGIIPGVATREDIVAAYGEPTRLYESEDDPTYATLTYEQDIYESVEFRIVDSVLNEVVVENLTEPEDMPKSEVSQDVPDYIKEYQAPTALSEDPTSLIVEYEGGLYQLPAPISAFEANGWTVVETRDEFVVAGGYSYVEMRAEGKNETLRFMTDNNSDLAVLPVNCVISELEVYGEDAPSLKLTGGITLGSTKDEVMAVFGDTFTDSSEGDEDTTYTARESGVYDFRIVIDNATNLVTFITVSD